MVTGDHPITASSIARQIGLIGGKVDVVQEAGGAGRHRRQTVVVDLTNTPSRAVAAACNHQQQLHQRRRQTNMDMMSLNSFVDVSCCFVCLCALFLFFTKIHL
jgi:magnesium-transporting ATPase (P-type)